MKNINWIIISFKMMDIKCCLTQHLLGYNREGKSFLLVHREDSGNWNRFWRYDVLGHAKEKGREFLLFLTGKTPFQLRFSDLGCTSFAMYRNLI